MYCTACKDTGRPLGTWGLCSCVEGKILEEYFGRLPMLDKIVWLLSIRYPDDYDDFILCEIATDKQRDQFAEKQGAVPGILENVEHVREAVEWLDTKWV